MNALDIGIIIITVFFVVRGIFRGFFREIGSIVGLILGLILAIWASNSYYSIAAEYISPYIGIAWRDVLYFISFALIFFIVMAACILIGLALQRFAKAVFFGWLDRSLGATLALVKAVLISYLIILLITFFFPSQQPIIVKSKLAPVIISLYQAGSDMIPRETCEEWKGKFFDLVNQFGKEFTEDKEEQRGENEPES